MDCIANRSARTFSQKAELLVFSFPFFFLLCAYLILLYSRPTYQQLFGILEEGLFEWIQFLCYLGAALVGLINFQMFRKRPSFVLQKYLMLLFILGCTFLAFEEISWGQHIFKWNTPESFSQINLQKETNLHNLIFIQGKIQVMAYIVVGWFGGLSWLLRRESGTLTLKDLVLTEWFISSYFLPLAVFFTQLLYLFGRGNNHQETFETLLSFGLLAIAIVNLRKTKGFFSSSQLHHSPDNPLCQNRSRGTLEKNI